MKQKCNTNEIQNKGTSGRGSCNALGLRWRCHDTSTCDPFLTLSNHRIRITPHRLPPIRYKYKYKWRRRLQEGKNQPRYPHLWLWRKTTQCAGCLAARKPLPAAKPNHMLGLYHPFPSLSVSYYTLANKDVTTDAPAYHCSRHDLSTFLRCFNQTSFPTTVVPVESRLKNIQTRLFRWLLGF